MKSDRRLRGERRKCLTTCVLPLVSVSVLLLGSGCATSSPCAGNHLHYEYAAQVLAMPSCKATMELVSPCKRRFRTASGRELLLGGPGADREVAGFLGTLEEGKSYRLPGAFMEYRNREAGPNE
ncbi:MAG: hypothetical protein HN742_30570 [Lentisphaerae bacterium]|nr:hypothetical protein [Lentisphaerota bacterium]MBT4820965.1 hypothetical protein [Lentisphaerota bacterium]MBT5612075.1 hypothetical protein [Lentisphaerota bacterium]MBT7061882.1 hypothetical protein [Lentisphaerota bacterium]MBT7846255.1 hypothetical protein [Lentisphaerota bacterium]